MEGQANYIEKKIKKKLVVLLTYKRGEKRMVS